MDPAHATQAIWHDPLSYSYLKDGPPYLPGLVGGKVASGSGAWLRQAHLEMGGDVGIALEHCLAEYGGAPYAELSVVMAALRAEAMIHQTHHWQTRGQAYYADHQLFERIYGAVNGFIDGLAEKAVGLGGEVLVQPLLQVSQVTVFSKLFYGDAPVKPYPEELPLLSLRALLKSSILLQMAYGLLKEKGNLSLGTDNFLQGVADTQENLVYLLKQRTKTREASDMALRVASRYSR